MKNKNIPAFITLLAGTIASILCIVNSYSLLEMLKIVLIVLIIFYIVGLIAGRIMDKMNADAEAAYILAERERMKAERKTEDNFDNDTEDENLPEEDGNDLAKK
ncbi:MAG: hypothetical protein E7256_00750 [Lachnospiraceae bacterium]|nr:hypothetical protein [Lachnospiraceae bacterium]